MSKMMPRSAPDWRADAPDLLQGYHPAAGAHDEMMAPEGIPRPHWQALLSGVQSMSEAERARARDTAQRMLRENGVTYVAQGDPDRTNRPWRLDLLPMVLGAAEWRELQSGLEQRARLLNSMLVDFYGPQRLLKEGVVPPALLFGNPRFLRPCHGIEVPEDKHLHFLAFDLARSPDGRWWVLSDRTQAPAGIGYALENRIVSSRCLPELFDESNVLRLASFFQTFSENILRLARREDPLAVVHSPGPSQATYFEHAYLARYLGYTVVEGSDLTVRDSRLYLKTVEGLKPIDVVLRRIDSELCDPLELQADSLSGVPGLVQAVCAGQVAVANSLGSGALENEALAGFLPAASRTLLDEELKLPGVATWWCGQAQAKSYVLDNLTQLIVRKINTPSTILAPGRDSFIGPELSDAERHDLARRIERRGQDFIGQEIVALSRAPIWGDDGRLHPAAMKLRVYLTAKEDGYLAMPGGLTRVYPNADPRALWLEPGEFSKDTWVLGEGPADTFSLLAQAQQDLRIRRGKRDLPSRAADNLFWLGRYVERSEGAARLLRSLVTRLGGEAGASADPITLDKVVSLLVGQSHLSARRAKRTLEGGLQAVERELWTILFDPDCPDGLATILGNARRTAQLVRERLSLDTWQIIEVLTEIEHSWPLDPGREIGDALRLLNRMIRHLAALNGMVMENMTRGYGWRFLDMGRRLERVRTASKLIRDLTTRGEPEAEGSLDLLLELGDSTMTYHTRYKARPQLPAVLDLLLADDTNPRSLIFQLGALDQHLGVMPPLESETGLGPARKVVVALRTEIQLADMPSLAKERRKSGLRIQLDRLLRRLDGGVHELSDLVARSFFIHSMPQHVTGPHRPEAMP